MVFHWGFRTTGFPDFGQQLASRTEQPNGTDQGGTPSEKEELEDFKEKQVVESRALLQLQLDSVPVDAAGFRTWRNALLAQIAKLDMSNQGIVRSWLSRSFRKDREILEDPGLLPHLDAWIAVKVSSLRVLKQVPGLEQEVTVYVERCGQKGASPKGRFRPALLARYFDLDGVRISVDCNH